MNKVNELEALKALSDEAIDTSDAPELSTTTWAKGVRGQFYRPIKKQVTLRIDADVLAWLQQQGKGYQTRINQILREAMTAPH